MLAAEEKNKAWGTKQDGYNNQVIITITMTKFVEKMHQWKQETKPNPNQPNNFLFHHL